MGPDTKEGVISRLLMSGSPARLRLPARPGITWTMRTCPSSTADMHQDIGVVGHVTRTERPQQEVHLEKRPLDAGILDCGASRLVFCRLSLSGEAAFVRSIVR